LGGVASNVVFDVLRGYFTPPFFFATTFCYGATTLKLVYSHRTFAAIVVLMIAISDNNLSILPSLAGFNLLEVIIKAANGKGLGPAITRGPFRLHLV
jgi:hypothetical protein